MKFIAIRMCSETYCKLKNSDKAERAKPLRVENHFKWELRTQVVQFKLDIHWRGGIAGKRGEPNLRIEDVAKCGSAI